MLGALGGVWQSFEQIQPLAEVTDRLYVGRALAGSLPCPLPIRDRLLNQSSLGVMMGKEFRLRFLDVRETRFQHLRNLLVILLAFALEQRLIGRVLNQRMLEEVGCLRREPALIEQFGLD